MTGAQPGRGPVREAMSDGRPPGPRSAGDATAPYGAAALPGPAGAVRQAAGR